MKNSFFALLMATVITCSCNKDNNSNDTPLPNGTGCIERIIIPANSNVSFSTAEYNEINGLFVSNGVNKPNYRYFRSYVINGTRLVHTMQYANGLPIFNKDLNFNFNNGVFGSFAGYLTNGTTLNTLQTLSLPQLRTLFIDNAEQFEHKGLQYKDSCVKAEFGYYDLNSGSGSTTEDIVKSWKLTLKSSTEPFEYPIAYYRDDNGSLIYYDNGIRTFH
jgi:hypothetical protein